MSYTRTPALPCIVCGNTLLNVFPGTTNQPMDGIVCFSSGNYGSTVYDSFNGNKLEFNVCDPCLVRAGEQGRVLEGREHRPVTVEGVAVGYEDVEYAPVQWHQGMDSSYGEHEHLQLDIDEPLDGLPSTVHIDQQRYNLMVALSEEDRDN